MTEKIWYMLTAILLAIGTLCAIQVWTYPTGYSSSKFGIVPTVASSEGEKNDDLPVAPK